MVGHADHVFVVLDHQHAVADVAQVLQRADQAVVVALVQSDAGLVEHIHHACEPRANLTGQADALGFTAREGVGIAVQAQIIQAHVVQKLEPQRDLAHHLVGDLGLCPMHFQALKILLRLTQGDVADLENGACLCAFADEHMASLAPQACALAAGARLHVAVARQVFAHHGRVGLAVAPRHVGDDPLKRVLLADLFALRGSGLHGVAELDLFQA